MTAAWDGVPLNPEREGWHWLMNGNHEPYLLNWSADAGRWGGYPGTSPADMVEFCTYLSPCLTPAEVAAAIREAEARGMLRAAEIAEKETAGGLSPYNLRHAVIAIRTAAAIRGGAGDE